MSHLNAAAIAAHLAGLDPAATEHVKKCDPCTKALMATELMAHATFGDDAGPSDGRRRAADMNREFAEVGALKFEAVMSLLESASVAREQDPRPALETGRRAIALAETLTGDSTLVGLLRARAWRECASTLRFLGEYDRGLAALDTAERHLRGVPVRAHEDAQIAYTRATILWKTRANDSRARSLAKAAAVAFAEHGDSLRVVHAHILIAGIDFVEGDFGEARAAYMQAFESAASVGDSSTIAHLHQNIAACAQELGDLPAAAMHYASAVALFAHLEMFVEELRADWNRGLLSLRMGHVRDGRSRLKRAADGFLAHGNGSDAALVILDLVEHLAVSGERPQAMKELARTSSGALPQYIQVQLGIVRAALRGGDPVAAVRDVRMVLQAHAP